MISNYRKQGFTLIEMAFGILMLGLVLVAFANIFALFQRSAGTTRDYAGTQQNARLAVDYLTEYLRQAGAGTDYSGGQRHIVHAGPYQIAINADIDNSQAIAGDSPLGSISIGHSPAVVPAGGTTIYAPQKDFNSSAETVVLTLDSESDGTVDSGDKGDDPEEGRNPRLYVLKRVAYGFNGSMKNEVHSANLAVVRGPDPYNNGTRPEPLFQYYYDHDADDATPERLWGDTDLDGSLSNSEIASLGNMPDPLLGAIRKIHVTVISESNTYDHRVVNTTDGYRAVTMNSEIYVRNNTRLRATVYGYVFHDLNGDGTQDPNENGIPNVDINIGPDQTVATNGFGVYSVALGPGTWALEEIDPSGYSSTTTNTISITLTPGEVSRIDFGDQVTSGTGTIKGTVYHDLNADGVMGGSEAGVPGVTITVDNGVEMRTDGAGRYKLVVPLGNYVVTETDPPDWGSTTSNTASVSITAAGQVSQIDFGDVETPLYGRIEGFVFEDENKNGARDLGDAGIPNVTLTLSTGDSTHTDAAGHYYFDVVGGNYGITERDESGYSSSTPNTVLNLLVVPDTLITLDFGDFLNSATGFDEVAAGSLKDLTSVALGEFNEDGVARSDRDILVGYARPGNSGRIAVFHNQWQNATTPITQLFMGTPTYQRDVSAVVNAALAYDFNKDGAAGAVVGLGTAAATNLQIWANDGTGTLGTSPSVDMMSQSSTSVLDTRVADVNADGRPDLIAGLGGSSGTYLGAIEVFLNTGSFAMSQHLNTANFGLTPLGEIHSLAAGDIDGDGDLDIVTGSHESNLTGYIDVWQNTGYATGYFQWLARYDAPGAVNVVRIVDLMEDNNYDTDIIAAVTTQSLQGAVYAWYSDGGVFADVGGAVPAGGAGVTPATPDATYDTRGEPLSMDVADLSGDIFPDIVVGTKSTAFYGGDIHLIATRGQLSAQAVQLNQGYSGEYGAVVIGDINNDFLLDIVAGTRMSPSQGSILLYVNNGGGQ